MSAIQQNEDAGNSTPDAQVRAEFDTLLRQIPDSETAWAARQAKLRAWRVDPRFAPYAAVIDQMMTVDFESFQRLAAVSGAGGLDDYDFDAWREQREYDLTHSHDHLP
jgi:hypothetical protein